MTEEAELETEERDDPEVRRVKFVLFAVAFSAISILIVVLLLFFQPEAVRTIERWPNGYPKVETHWVEREGVRVRDGRYRAWYESGLLAEEGEYRDGEKEGEWKAWLEGGAPDPMASGRYSGGERIDE